MYPRNVQPRDKAHASVCLEFAYTHILSTLLGRKANISTTTSDGKHYGLTGTTSHMYIMKPLADHLPAEICKMLLMRA